LTPHPGEFARLDGGPVTDDDDERAVRCAAAARRWGHVVVLKGAHTIVADASGNVARAPFENPALATAGTGDVLAGTIAALLGQGCAPSDGATVGVYLHGLAGERWRERVGDAGLVASDLPLEVAFARRRLEDVRQRGGRRLGFGTRDAARG
jgi:NAD(P)H-hydrate epimerase